MRGDIQLGTSGDIEIVGGKIPRIESTQDAVAQRLKIRFESLLGEWLLDESFGFPWLTQVLIKGPDAFLLETLFKDTIVTTDGVLALVAFSLDIDDERLLSVVFTVVVDGAVQLAAQIEIPVTTEFIPGGGFVFTVLGC